MSLARVNWQLPTVVWWNSCFQLACFDYEASQSLRKLYTITLCKSLFLLPRSWLAGVDWRSSRGCKETVKNQILGARCFAKPQATLIGIFMVSCKCRQCSYILFGGLIASLKSSFVWYWVTADGVPNLLTPIHIGRKVCGLLKHKIDANQVMFKVRTVISKEVSLIYDYTNSSWSPRSRLKFGLKLLRKDSM